MKRGRPTLHIKAKWITYMDKDEETFFELDEKGRIISKNKNKITPHHSAPVSVIQKKLEFIAPTVIDTTVIEEKKQISFPSIISPISFPLYNGSFQQSQPILINLLPFQKPPTHISTGANDISHVQQLTIV